MQEIPRVKSRASKPWQASYKSKYFPRKGKSMQNVKRKNGLQWKRGKREGGRACEQLLRPDPQLPVPRRASHTRYIGNGCLGITRNVASTAVGKPHDKISDT